MRKSKAKGNKSKGKKAISRHIELLEIMVGHRNIHHIIGCDNGVTGTIGFLDLFPKGNMLMQYGMIKTPVEFVPSINLSDKKTKQVNRQMFKIAIDRFSPDTTVVLLERPYLNPRRFWASISAIKTITIQQIVLEDIGFKINKTYFVIDSKEWQEELLPEIHGSDALKKASLEVGKQLFPKIKIKHDDYDGILIAEWLRRQMEF